MNGMAPHSFPPHAERGVEHGPRSPMNDPGRRGLPALFGVRAVPAARAVPGFRAVPAARTVCGARAIPAVRAALGTRATPAAHATLVTRAVPAARTVPGTPAVLAVRTVREACAVLAVLAVTALAAPNGAAAQFVTRSVEPLPPEDAFPCIAFAEAGAVIVSFQLPEGYYLYRRRFGFESLTDGIRLGPPELPDGRPHVDEFFGAVEIYRGDFEIRIPYRHLGLSPPGQAGQATGDADALRLRLELQGCADIGYCYLPVSWERRVELPNDE